MHLAVHIPRTRTKWESSEAVCAVGRLQWSPLDSGKCSPPVGKREDIAAHSVTAAPTQKSIRKQDKNLWWVERM